MTNSWHVNPETGNPGRCKVDWNNPRSRGCPHGFSEGEHFDSAIDAVNYYSERREATEDPFATVTAAQRQLDDLRESSKPVNQDVEVPQYLSKDVGEKSFWGRNGKKIGGAIVATFVLSTLTSLVVNNGAFDNADTAVPEQDSSVQEQVIEDYEDPLPLPVEEVDAPTAGELGQDVGEKLRETGERLSDEVTPERIEQVKKAGRSVKDFVNGVIAGTSFDWGSAASESAPVEASDGVQFQGKSLQPSAEEISAAQATLSELELRPENKSAYYNRVEQFGRSFQTGVVGRIEHRDAPQAIFKNEAPQSRAIGGGFIDPYTGEYVEIVKGSSTDTDLEHIVSLHEVVESESPSRPLSQSDRASIANDFDNLQLVGSSVNRSKGDKDPGEWMPPNKASHLRYAVATINVKSKYGLTVDKAEHDVLAAVLAGRQ